MEVLWEGQALSIREVQERLPKPQSAYTTVQTTIYRLEGKKAVRRLRKIGNAHIFEAAISREAAHGRLIDQVLKLFGGSIQPVMAHWVESGSVNADDIRRAEEMLKQLAETKKSKPQGKGKRS